VQVVATRSGLGRLCDGIVELLDSPFPHVGAVLEQTGSLDCLATARVLRQQPLAEVTLLSPVGTPRALWGVGLNYRSKAARTGRTAPVEPILYLAAGSAVVGPAAAVEIPVAQTCEMDYEGEIAVVIGRRLSAADPADVWPAVAGITAANDLTARDVMRRTGAPTLAKSFPGFNPLGASLRTIDELADPDRITLRTWLNGALVQDDDSSGMIFPIPDLLARLSRFVALEPGDVVLTGTPAGTGQDRQRFLAAGDEIRVEVDSVLALVTSVAAPATRPAGHALLADRAG
jgi:2-keto-4-pentenoate hydratase/2-oxohepta-3-ene-1,7-dioic acid hydratase in catechol pathway